MNFLRIIRGVTRMIIRMDYSYELLDILIEYKRLGV